MPTASWIPCPCFHASLRGSPNEQVHYAVGVLPVVCVCVCVCVCARACAPHGMDSSSAQTVRFNMPMFLLQLQTMSSKFRGPAEGRRDGVLTTPYVHVPPTHRGSCPAYLGKEQQYTLYTHMHTHTHTHTHICKICMYVLTYIHSHSHSHNYLSCRLLELPGISHRQVVPTLLDPVGPRAAGGGPQRDGGPGGPGILANQALGAVATAER